MNNLPEVMKNAREDLGGNISGYFCPEDWAEILKRAEVRWREELPACPDALVAWQAVIRDFHRQRYWGFTPHARPRKAARAPRNLGVSFIWMTFITLTITKVAVLWLGQIYAKSDDPWDAWLFFIVLAVVVGNFAFFLWRHRKHID